MQRGVTSQVEGTTLASDLRRLLVLGLLTALAVMLCERWSEAAVISGGDRAALTVSAGSGVSTADAPPPRAR